MFRAIILGLLVFAGCTTSSEEECNTDLCVKQRAYDKVLAVHDEVMPKLATITTLKEKLEQQVAEARDDSTVMAVGQLVAELTAADEAMWVWMRQFNKDLEEMPLEEALAYLQEEQAKIETVGKEINRVIDEAEAALKATE